MQYKQKYLQILERCAKNGKFDGPYGESALFDLLFGCQESTQIFVVPNWSD